MDLVTATGLSKRYGGIVALSEAEFSARAGEVHALLGENGAGKSTFIQILSGAVQHDGGAILVDGQRLSPGQSRRRPRRAASPPVFRELSLIPDLTVEQNIWFRREPSTLLRHGATARRCGARRWTLLENIDFPPLRPDQELRRLTLAERQIVEIAKGLAKEPRILILDEATSALPAREAEWLLKLTRRLCGRRPAGHLHLPPHGRGARHRRPPHHLPQRPHRRRA